MHRVLLGPEELVLNSSTESKDNSFDDIYKLDFFALLLLVLVCLWMDLKPKAISISFYLFFPA